MSLPCLSAYNNGMRKSNVSGMRIGICHIFGILLSFHGIIFSIGCISAKAGNKQDEKTTTSTFHHRPDSFKNLLPPKGLLTVIGPETSLSSNGLRFVPRGTFGVGRWQERNFSRTSKISVLDTAAAWTTLSRETVSIKDGPNT